MNQQITAKVLATMLQFALVEIRSNNDIELIQSIADIFHNVPVQLVNHNESESLDGLYTEICERAKRQGLYNYTIELRESAERSIT